MNTKGNRKQFDNRREGLAGCLFDLMKDGNKIFLSTNRKYGKMLQIFLLNIPAAK